MMFAATDPVASPVVVQIATAFFSLLGMIFSGIMTYLMARLNIRQEISNAKADDVAVKVEQVREKAQEAAANVETVKNDLKVSTQESREEAANTSHKLDDLAKVSEATHTLVNNKTALQLLAHLQILEELADETKKPKHIEAVRLAQAAYAEHLEKQAQVDAQIGTDAEKQGKGRGDF